jgi:beta-lactamase regulating signal transducer with metallopeptidase domain
MSVMTMTAAVTWNAIALHAIAQASAVQIVDCLIEGTLIAVFAGAVLRAARPQNSSTRFAVWFSALMGIAALPALSGISGASARTTSLPVQTVSPPAITLPGSWALYLFAAWAAIAAWHLLGVARGLWHLRVLRNSCVPVDSAMLDARLREALARNASSRNGTPRPVVLCTSDLVQVPTAIGLVKPAIIFPSWIVQELSAEELNQILLHELAHLRRYDDWTNLAQKLVKALFFFHPAVWWIEKQISLEREMACDDAVVAETARPRAYAECLAHLAEKTLLQRSVVHRNLVQRGVALAQAALGRIRHTSLRVAQILDGNRPMGTRRSWKPAVSLVAAFALACVAWISRAPRLIAFQDSTPVAPASVIAASSSSTPGAPFLARPVRGKWKLTPAKLTTVARHRKPKGLEKTAALHSSVPEQRAATMFHLTSAADAPPIAFTETLFVVVESSSTGPSDQPVFQIQLWRVTVWHPAVDPNSNRIPPKQT